MNILVTGGAGYIGSQVCATLAASGFTCMAYDDFSTGHPQLLPTGSWVEGDVRDEKKLHEVFASFRPGAVIHLAALATLGACAARPEDCRSINEEGTRNVLEAMRAFQVRHMVFAGSCAVYAPATVLAPLEEDGPLSPTTVYGESKLAAEQLLESYRAHGIHSVAFRLFNVAGADGSGKIGELHNPETHLLPLALEAALGKRGPLDVYGRDYPTRDGTAVRDYIHVCDVADACVAALNYLERTNTSQTLNLGSGIPTSVRQLLAAVAEQAGEVPFVMKPRREGDVAWLVADIERMGRVLSWRPRWSDMETLVRTALQWHRQT